MKTLSLISLLISSALITTISRADDGFTPSSGTYLSCGPVKGGIQTSTSGTLDGCALMISASYDQRSDLRRAYSLTGISKLKNADGNNVIDSSGNPITTCVYEDVDHAGQMTCRLLKY